MKPLREPGRFRIRQACQEDLLDAARMKAAAWRESYDFDDAAFASLEELAPRTADHWAQICREGGYIWLVVDSHEGNRLVGVAHAGIGRDEDAPTPLELTMIYLLDVAKGSGIADRLLEMTIGDAPAYLWALAGNARAMAFYQRHGFAADGGRTELTGVLAGVPEIRMIRR